MAASELELPAPRPVVRPLERPSTRRSHAPPLGVYATPEGVDVAVVASHATAVEFCLIDDVDPTLAANDPKRYRETRVDLHGPTYGVWHAHVAGVRPGQRYGFRVHGPWDPAAGLRHNPHKLLVDPYARGISGDLTYGPEPIGEVSMQRGVDGPDARWWVGDGSGEMDTIDSLPYVPHSVVMESMPPAPPLTRPRVPWADTVIYEAHVRGFTLLNEAIPEALRGTYAGMAHPSTIAYLKDLGITTLELLPIHRSLSEPRLFAHRLANYWGYSTLGFFAPEPRYATKAAQEAGPEAVLDEVRGMVHLLHQAGIEVLLDVVYNHTCEGGADQLQISWRGLDNTLYYMHDGNNPTHIVDVTGTGNSLDFRQIRVIQMTLDSLRYWAEDIGVDGFRFDLAVTLGRGHYGFSADHPFLVALQTDPILNNLKLIAEPWDVGPYGWQTGSFPSPMAEWNDRFRDAVRGFWLASPSAGMQGRPMDGVRELTTRLAGSQDLFGNSDPPLMRGPVASINYVTSHDGFTLADLVSYDYKHNWANDEDNNDGANNNLSWNCGVEGIIEDDDLPLIARYPDVLPRRRREQRNLLAMLILSAGTPMITAGDEFSRSQAGNNNAYAQDNAISWVNWQLDQADENLLETTKFLLALRREHPALRADSFFLGTPRPGQTFTDLLWFTEQGEPMSRDNWDEPGRRVVQMLRPGPNPGDADVLIIINGALQDIDVVLPTHLLGSDAWELVWDSSWDTPNAPLGTDEDAAVSRVPWPPPHQQIPPELAFVQAVTGELRQVAPSVSAALGEPAPQTQAIPVVSASPQLGEAEADGAESGWSAAGEGVIAESVEPDEPDAAHAVTEPVQAVGDATARADDASNADEASAADDAALDEFADPAAATPDDVDAGLDDSTAAALEADTAGIVALADAEGLIDATVAVDPERTTHLVELSVQVFIARRAGGSD